MLTVHTARDKILELRKAVCFLLWLCPKLRGNSILILLGSYKCIYYDMQMPRWVAQQGLTGNVARWYQCKDGTNPHSLYCSQSESITSLGNTACSCSSLLSLLYSYSALTQALLLLNKSHVFQHHTEGTVCVPGCLHLGRQGRERWQEHWASTSRTLPWALCLLLPEGVPGGCRGFNPERVWLLLGGSSLKEQYSIGNDNANNLAPVRREVRNAHAQL